MYPGWSILGQRCLDGQTETLPVTQGCAGQVLGSVTRAALNRPSTGPHSPLLLPRVLHQISPAGTFPQITGVGWCGGHLFPPLACSIKSWGAGE